MDFDKPGDARAGTRTRTARRPGDFKSRASTSFATRAGRPRNLPRHRRAALPSALPGGRHDGRTGGKAGPQAAKLRVSRTTSCARRTTSLGRDCGAMRAASGGPRRSARAVGSVRPARTGRRSGRCAAGGPRRLGGDLGPPLARRRAGTARRGPVQPRRRERPPSLAERRGRAHRPDHGPDGLPPQSGRAHHRRAGRRKPRLAGPGAGTHPGDHDLRQRAARPHPGADALRPHVDNHVRRRPHARAPTPRPRSSTSSTLR